MVSMYLYCSGVEPSWITVRLFEKVPVISTFVYSVLLKKKVKIVYQLFKISSHFLVFEMLEEKWKMPTAQVKNVMENVGILSLNCTADFLNV